MGAPALPDAPARLRRSTHPTYIADATRFADEPPSFRDPVQVVRRVKGMAPLMRTLEQARINHGHGPARGDGNWALAYLAFVISGHANMRPWWRDHFGNSPLWQACGFTSTPAYSTLWERFTELERHADVFEAAAHHLIRLARRQAPEVGMWLVVDGTECQTHAQPQHNCGPNDACPGSRNGRIKPRFPKITPEEAALRRSKAEPAEEPAEQPALPAPRADGLLPIPEDGYQEETAEGLRFTSGGHWWLSRDRDAGGRAYGDKKAWHGYMCVQMTDAHTGAVIAVRIIPAQTQEAHSLPDLYESARQGIGTDPIAVVGDRGYSIGPAFRFLTERGVAPIFPWRDFHRGTQPKAPPGRRWDRHGIPVCPGCGLSGDFVRFSAKGSPRTWYRCPMPSTPECEGEHSIGNLEAPRRLLPIWRTSTIYAALRPVMNSCERVHTNWRERYRVGGKTLADRPRRIGLAWQQLRANAALMIEWLWTNLRQGWIGARRSSTPAKPLPVGSMYENIIKARRAESLFGGRYPSRGGPPTP